MSKMRGFRWTEELDLKLIKHCRKFSCIWMTRLPGYKNLDKRYAAYVKIVEALRPDYPGLTVPKLVYKIRDLRYRHCSELTKIERAAGANCGPNLTANFHWFEYIDNFLDLRFNYNDENNKIKESFSAGTEEFKLEVKNTGTYLTPSTCQTIYDNRLKMVEDSRSTVWKFEESDNDNDEPYDRTEEWCNVAEVWRKDVEMAGRNEWEKNGVERNVHSNDMKLEAKATKILHENEHRKDTRTVYYTEESADDNNSLSKTVEFDEFDAFAMSIGSQLKSLDPILLAKLEVMIFIILEEERAKNHRH